MDIRKIITNFKKWILLLLLAAVIGAWLGYYLSNRKTPMYRTSTRFVVLRAASTSSYDYYAYLDYQNMISTYEQLLSTEYLLSQVSEEVGFPVYANQASAEQINETQFVRLTVTHEDPVKAAIVANALVNVLIEQNEQLQSVRYETTERNYQARADQTMAQIDLLQEQIQNLSVINLEEQIAQVEIQIGDLQTQVTDLEFNINRLNLQFPTEEQTLQKLRYQAELNQVKPLLDQYQEIYTNLIVMGEPMENENASSTQMAQLQRTLDLYEQIYFSSISSLEILNLTRVQSSPNVVQVEPASVPKKPYAPRPFQTGALYGAVGLLLMGGIAYLVEYFDDTIKTPKDVEEHLGLPVIGLIADMKGDLFDRNKDEKNIFVASQPRSPISEAFRSLRTSLEFYSVDEPLELLLVTSSGPEEGKTTVAANLAAILAKSDKKVLLLDADMRRPNVHSHLGISNRMGLSDLIRGRMSAPEVIQHSEGVENLFVMTSGSLPPNPAELLTSKRMGEILIDLKKQFEVIIIDTPPSVVTDAQILSTKADGVIFVIRPGKTRLIAARTPLEEFNRVGAKIVGVVMNRIPRNREFYYGGYDYYAPKAHISEKYYRTGFRDQGEKSVSAVNPIEAADERDSDNQNS
ncbi:MAG: polysaccharide biosynthesis tyrosine autokinase [Brevefilum sp.]|nr:polysaccharide biosynthesis tyrosine autokinase [Brevefilum sp.]